MSTTVIDRRAQRAEIQPARASTFIIYPRSYTYRTPIAHPCFRGAHCQGSRWEGREKSLTDLRSKSWPQIRWVEVSGTRAAHVPFLNEFSVSCPLIFRRQLHSTCSLWSIYPWGRWIGNTVNTLRLKRALRRLYHDKLAALFPHRSWCKAANKPVRLVA